ncbi:mannitol-1-phosphate 5-dehydrogenase [Homoserinibacter sp. YIM 151385]|uniref:mannitol-1-phosphate 5-dehydrogenase n=1 Tax=Homoserinibacter sp. YIM 151385 TaxID=2985506 RepID=UPI0022F0BB54|nr:mannitol-1-phosphate 5-dehydrogenase [Homoserinibacter sp. YIM 151385]WBU39280.1 mannitol-1-phosphate 5-dehydrogenase [Homoserinibacter sp. YIM 151385]
MTKTAVHFGAGNIGRGFVAQFLHESGYEVVFADVSDELIGALQARSSYTVHEVGHDARDHVVDGYRAINSRDHEAEVVAEIAQADLVTTAVGARILPFVAPLVARGLAARAEGAAPLVVIACENAIGGTDILAEAVRTHGDASRAVFANCAIDRIVPEQHGGLDVTIESFSEWVVDRTAFERHPDWQGAPPEISGVTWVEDLAPFIERKLFTVNTAHATAAYHGTDRGWESIREALASPELQAEVRAVLDETKRLIVLKHGFSEEEQQAYIEKTLARISNPELPDTCERVGRGPLRKLSRHERFIAPAAELVERGETAWDLLNAVGAALRFDVAADAESVELQQLLASGRDAADLAETVTGIEPSHPLFPHLVEVFQLRLDR